MKRLLSTLLATLACCGALWAAQPGGESMREFLGEFQNPDKQYRSAPLMVWNTKVSQYQIDNMLREFSEQGFGGVFIHPRQGLITPYLSQEWHDLAEYTVRRGREFGLDTWLYDENSYPSGFAGGYVPHEMPESYNEGQALAETKVSVMPADVSPYEVIVSEKNGKFENVTAKAAKMAGKKGTFYLYEKTYYESTPWYAGTSYVDLLKPGVTEKFMEVTMRGYEKTLGSDLKQSVKGIFTDEPEIVSPGGLRWTPDLFEQFKLMYGYDLSALLPCLNSHVGDWKKVRHDYYALLLHLFTERWAKPWYNYCEEKGLVWTGHYWEHCWPIVAGVPDNMTMASWQQMPGIDMLFNTYNEEKTGAQFGNIRSVKEVRSVANQMGRKRVLSETYGGAGWQVTFKDLKRLADWQFVLGVNFVNQHISQMSILGLRKTDYPPFFTRTASWWSDYKLLNDYNARLSAAMSAGDQINDILVLEPTTSVWLYSMYDNNYGEAPAGAQRIGDAFQAFVTRLEKAQVEYDLGCEDIFKRHGSVQGDRFVVGQRAYKTFVLPPLTENVDSETFALLKEFAANGGTIVALSVPTRVDGAYSAEAEAFFMSDRVTEIDYEDERFIDKYLRSDAIRFLQMQGGNTYHQRRQFSDGQLLLLANVSLDEATEVKLEVEGKYAVRMDALDGKTYELPNTFAGPGKVAIHTRVLPAETILIRISDTPAAAEKPVVPGTLTALQPMRPMQIERLRENVLVVDFVDLECGGKTWNNVFWATAGDAIYQEAGLERNPWWRAMQHKSEIADLDLSHAPGFTASYRFTVNGPVDLASMLIVVENPTLYTIKINGNEVRGGYYWVADEDMKRIAIGPYVKEGENVVTLSAPHPTALTELCAIYVMGNFNVANRNEKWVIEPVEETGLLVDWKQLGAPFYPWEMRYSKFYDVVDPSKRYWIEAPDWNGSLVQVWINDRKAGVIFAEPNRLDVTPFVQEGANRVELRVVGNMENMLGAHHKQYDGLVSPWQFIEIEDGRTPSQYHLSRFGLFSDFVFAVEK